MKYLLGALLLGSVAGCQTSSGVIDTANVVSKLAVQLNGTIVQITFPRATRSVPLMSSG